MFYHDFMEHMPFFGFWGLVIGVIILLILTGTFVFLLLNKGKTREPGNEALEILKRKLAQGEISVEEYEKKKEVLMRR